MNNKNICPISSTHKRLNHVLSIFDDINKSYQDPDKFTSDLNNIIQALRNITFILQSEKSKIKNFDEWYKPFQEAMRKDDVMLWLVDSRNHVVKKGDLEKDSYLSIRIVDHFNHEIFVQKFDPFITTDEAVQLFRKIIKIKFFDVLKDDVIIEAEREWVVSSYSKAELVDVLIYCFSILVNIIENAHIISNNSILNCKENEFFSEEKDFMVVLRNKLKKSRITKVSYSDGNPLVSNITRIDKTEMFKNYSKAEIKKKVTEKYGDISELKKIMEPTSEEIPFCFLDYHLEMSKKFMLSDGGILTACFFYFSKEEPPRMTFFVPENPVNRFNMAENIADIAEETHCKAIIFISEMWLGDVPKNKKDYIPARLQENRKEAVSILAATPNKIKSILVPFHRENGKIVLEKEQLEKVTEWPFLSKLQKVWKNQLNN